MTLLEVLLLYSCLFQSKRVVRPVGKLAVHTETQQNSPHREELLLVKIGALTTRQKRTCTGIKMIMKQTENF